MLLLHHCFSVSFCVSCWSRMKRAPPLSATSTPAQFSRGRRDPGSLWMSQRPWRTGCQTQVSSSSTTTTQTYPIIIYSVCIYMNNIYQYSSSSHVYFFFFWLQRIIWAWSWASTVPAAPSSPPPTTLFPTRVKSWRPCLQVCLFFAVPFISTAYHISQCSYNTHIICVYVLGD